MQLRSQRHRGDNLAATSDDYDDVDVTSCWRITGYSINDIVLCVYLRLEKKGACQTDGSQIL